MTRARTAAGLALGAAADRLIGDPRRGHPVALFGTAAAALERHTWRDSRAAGTGYAAVCVATCAVGGVLLERCSGRTAAVAVSTWAVLGARTLGREAAAVAELLAADDLPAARQRLTHLVGRDTSVLDVDGVSRAVVESVAENACDAVVAPLLWGAVGGAPALLAYRAANTLDAMVGYRSPRHERFGWAAARLDDVLNLAPARLTALLTAVAAPVVGGSPRTAVGVTRRFGRAHPSPNSGMGEAAFAGALDVRLGGRNAYAGRVEDRPVIGDGAACTPADIARAGRLLDAVTVLAVGAAVVLAGAGTR